ncbi:MAG: hypothetical protein GY737_23985 [Desulfobacteraceae bacterium]|nr:hypothetical protein [Desulfobacteraceae bacterium]
MKRFTGILAAAAIAIAPMSASALEALTDNAMNSVTAQAGVSIGLDDIVIYQTGIADTTYTDTDGTSYIDILAANPQDAHQTYGNVARAGIMIDYDDALQKLTIIDGITDADDKGGKYSAAELALTFTDAPAVGFIATGDVVGTVDPTTGNNFAEITDAAVDNYTTGARPLTIDVGTCQALTKGYNWNGGVGDIAGVIIGLPTIEIQSYHTTDTKTVKLVGAVGAANNDRAFIEITKSGHSTMAILGGRLEIAPH